ncbi:MAG: YjbQ family protein [Candidatus Aenigmarchaeota archaeon]|nr:YjbQ family protein [Candidatus Aenigmarchaeota archaeon]
MTYSETIEVKIKSQDFHDITGEVENIIRKSEIDDGICNIFAIGATGAIVVNENEPMLLEDFRRTLEKISSSKKLYQHIENAHSHIRSMLIGNSQSIPVKEGRLMLGTWQNIMVINFDTRNREREVLVTVVGD